MAKKTGLGKGLSELFIDNATEELSSSSAVKLKLSEIEPNKNQPRKNFDEEALAELSHSIELHGVLQPLVVRPMPDGSYQLVAGERRWRASRIAGLTEVPVVIKELTDAQVAEIALVENLQREDLDPIEEALGYKELAEKFDYTQEEISNLVGASRPAIANALRLLTLPEEIIALVSKKELSAGHARALLTLEDDKAKIELAKLVIKEDISVRETERLARKQIKVEPTGKKTKKRNPYYDEVELALSDVLQRKVRVTKSTKKGAIEIEFFDDEDLKKLIKIFDNE
ncbi:MAG: ParB/RepB/Spo0J family partition protein [Ruminococcaceae bacterium]|nr:ParB/RepB/Spo0J family partition protein [Oscillospiraceae bacterium]